MGGLAPWLAGWPGAEEWAWEDPQPGPLDCERGWGGARRMLSLGPGTQRCSAVSCGPPALGRARRRRGGPPALSHSPGSDRLTRRCCQEEVHSATSSPHSALLGIGRTEVFSPSRPWLH